MLIGSDSVTNRHCPPISSNASPINVTCAALLVPDVEVVTPEASQSLIPPFTESSAVCGEYTDMPAAARRRRLRCRGLERVREGRGLKIVGW